jgi:hypothetical protein
MKMEKAILALLLVPLLVLGFSGIAVFAQEDNETPSDETPDEDLPEEEVPEEEAPEEELPEEEVPEEDAEDAAAEESAGTTPDSPLWGIDVALDRLRLALASNPDKARIGLLIAEERLAEIQVLGKKGKAEAALRAQEEHGRVIEDVKIRIEALDGAEIDNETLRGIELGMANHLAALAKVKARIEANPNIPEETKIRLLAKFTDLEGRAEELKIKIENRKMRIELKRELRLNDTNEDEGERPEENETKEEVSVEVEGNLTKAQQDVLDSLVGNLQRTRTSVEIEMNCEAANTDGDEELSICDVEVDGVLDVNQQRLLDSLRDKIEMAGDEVEIKISAEFGSEDEEDEDESDEDEDVNETDEDENETEGA